ncbi:MAG: DNA recombination protein RmuC [Thermoplasmata archaeon]|nr:DNA recombination protein RmuC [Thermoplasmata archaeon]
MSEIIFLAMGFLMGIFAGLIAGYFFGKSNAYKSVDLSQQSQTITNLTNQLTEMKIKFEEIEKSREEKEELRNKLDKEREKRLKEWMDQTNKLFKELSDKSEKTMEEKDKRIKEWMDQTKKFFEEQKKNTEKFLEEQGKSREEIEKKRDAQIKDMRNIINRVTRTIGGTQKRGQVGENLLREVLSHSIKAGVVKENLKVNGGEVEFAWNLEDGKYIPIDSKLPDVFDLVEKYNASEDLEEQQKYRKTIINKVKREIKRVQKYQNLSNTIDTCLLVVPEAVLEIAPSLAAIGRESNVFVCTYKDIFPIAHMIQEQYIRFKEEGDIGAYKQIIQSLFSILDKINKKTEVIERAVKTIKNANDSIKEEVIKGKRQTVIEIDGENDE